MSEKQPLREGQILTGSLFNEPMRVETVRSNGPDTWLAGLRTSSARRSALPPRGVAAFYAKET